MIRIFSQLARVAVTLVMVAFALVVGYQLWLYYMEEPWTRDGRVAADVVAVAPDVSGLVTDVRVRDNQNVKAGDILFRIDPERFTLALRQADAVVDSRKASADQASADFQRYIKLSDASVTKQQIDQVRATDLVAQAAYAQALADRDVARLNLARSDVRASVDGRITNMDLRPGTYVSVGHGVMALIDSSTVRVEGYFEETKLPRIHVGDSATIQLMGDTGVLKGHVESLAGGIEDRERSAGANLLANVNPTFSWVRLAQRVPVRITLDSPEEKARLIVGRTATVAIDEKDGSPSSPLDALVALLPALRPASVTR